jgi:hypothetical protein
MLALASSKMRRMEIVYTRHHTYAVNQIMANR